MLEIVRLHAWIYFYSRPCGRGDPIPAHMVVEPTIISTHAPAGGATAGRRRFPVADLYFYSRPCGRGDYTV